MPDIPISFTPRYSIAQWAEGAYAGADALNNNWSIIDAAIYSASFASTLVFLQPLRRSGNNINLQYNTDAFKITTTALDLNLHSNANLRIVQSGDGGLDTIQDIKTTSSPTFANLYATNDISASNYVYADLLYTTTQATLGTLIVQTDSYFGNFCNILGNGNTKFGLHNTTMSISGSIRHSGSLMQVGSASMLTNNYISGWAGSGWRLDRDLTQPGTSMELDSMWIRGSLNVYEIVMNTIRAVNGHFFISSTARVSSSAAGGPGDVRITFEDPEGHGVCPFAENDILLSQIIDLDNTTVVARTVVRVVGPPEGDTVEANYVLGTTIKNGSVFCRIGNSTNSTRQATIYMTSDDNYAPFIDMTDGVTSYAAWTSGEKLRMRIGKLEGVSSTAFGTMLGYGIYANGGIYLESSASANSIAMKVDSGSAMLTMNRGGETIFDFNTATSTAKIAGWNIDKGKLWQTADFYNEVILQGSGSYPYLYVAYGLGVGAEDRAVLMGRIPPAVGSLVGSTGEIGIIAYDGQNSERYFVLTNVTRSIADWNFDKEKLWKGTTAAALVLNTHTNPYISATGTGFEVYNPTNPKLFIGRKTGSFLDWNITTPGALTISGSIIGSEISASRIIATYIATGLTGKRLEINSGSLNNIKWTTATGKTFSMDPQDQGALPGLNWGTAYLYFSSSATGQSSNIDYAIMGMYSASRSTLVRAEYTSYTGGGKPFIAYATASSATLTTGTVFAGNLASASLIDGQYFVIREVGGAPGMNFTMEFPVPNTAHPPVGFYGLGRYEGGAAHEIQVKVWNTRKSAYDTIGHIFNARIVNVDESYWLPFTQGSDYVSGSVVKMQFNHPDSGNTSHYAYMDFVAVAYLPYVRVDSNSTL